MCARCLPVIQHSVPRPTRESWGGREMFLIFLVKFLSGGRNFNNEISLIDSESLNKGWE